MLLHQRIKAILERLQEQAQHRLVQDGWNDRSVGDAEETAQTPTADMMPVPRVTRAYILLTNEGRWG